jgi:hypothetical protein
MILGGMGAQYLQPLDDRPGSRPHFYVVNVQNFFRLGDATTSNAT